MISLDKKYRTRDGREVRLYAVDAGGTYPIHGAIKIGDEWEEASWTEDGSYYPDSSDLRDLLERSGKTKREGWINIYPPMRDGVHPASSAQTSREAADRAAMSDRIACIRVEWEV